MQGLVQVLGDAAPPVDAGCLPHPPGWAGLDDQRRIENERQAVLVLLAGLLDGIPGVVAARVNAGWQVCRRRDNRVEALRDLRMVAWPAARDTVR